MKGFSNFVHVLSDSDRFLVYNALTTKIIQLNQEQNRKIQLGIPLNEIFNENELSILSKKGFIDDEEQLTVDTLVNENHQTRPEVFALYLILTERCNMNCVYCSQSAYRTRPRLSNMSIDVIENVLDKFYKTKTKRKRTVVLYGGEPTLNMPGIKYAISFIRNKKKDDETEIVIFTNSILITDDIIDFFNKNGVSVIISLDGPKEINDKFRLIGEEGSFNRINDIIMKFKNHDVKFGISATIASHNIKILPDIVTFFCNQYHPFSIGLNPLHYTPKERNRVSVDTEEMSRMMLKSYDIASEYGIYIEQVMRRVRPFVLEQPRLKDCPSCGGMIRVLPDGTFGPCGHFMEEQIARADIDSPFDNNPYVNKWNKRISCTMERCQKCPALSLCGGGCPFNSYKHGGNFFSPDDGRSCSQAFVFLKWLIHNTLIGLPSDQFYEVTIIDKEKILNNISLSKYVPMGDYSQYGEFRIPEQYK